MSRPGETLIALLRSDAGQGIRIDGAFVERRGEIDGQAVIAYVCTIEVADLAEVEQRVPAAGGQEVLARMAIPGVGSVAYFKDPEGNIFGALEPEAAG